MILVGEGEDSEKHPKQKSENNIVDDIDDLFDSFSDCNFDSDADWEWSIYNDKAVAINERMKMKCTLLLELSLIHIFVCFFTLFVFTSLHATLKIIFEFSLEKIKISLPLIYRSTQKMNESEKTYFTVYETRHNGEMAEIITPDQIKGFTENEDNHDIYVLSLIHI